MPPSTPYADETSVVGLSHFGTNDTVECLCITVPATSLGLAAVLDDTSCSSACPDTMSPLACGDTTVHSL